jgi:hypothetical protein
VGNEASRLRRRTAVAFRKMGDKEAIRTPIILARLLARVLAKGCQSSHFVSVQIDGLNRSARKSWRILRIRPLPLLNRVAARAAPMPHQFRDHASPGPRMGS